MKQTNKYVKTRGQRLALEQAHSKPHPLSVSNIGSFKPSSALVNNNSAKSPAANKSKPIPKKTKKIVKAQSTEQKKKYTNKIKDKIIQNQKIKSQKQPLTNLQLKKKITKDKAPLPKLKQKSALKKDVHTHPNQAINQPKGKTFKIKLSSSNQGQIKVEEKKVKKQNPSTKAGGPAEKKNQDSLPRPNKSVKKQSKGSKSKLTVANQDSPSQQNNNNNIKLESEAPKKKKGRPRKLIQINLGSKIEQRTLEEQKALDSFVESAIKIKKLKNERQFFESFSRIIEYMRDCWEYGELNKTLKVLPRPEDVLKIGIQIVRGIRKQLQIQAQTQPL